MGQYDGLVVRSATKVTPNVLKHATKMRVIGRAGVGVDNINIPEATKYGIMVMNTPGGNTVSTAQLAMSLLCNLARKLPQADMLVKAGKWEKKALMGVEMGGKTLGIVGCGRIGQVVASCASSLGMKVIGFDPVMTPEQMAEANIARVDLEDIWKQSDFITVHTPLTPQTQNLIGDETIAKCKTGVRIINCARGGIVDGKTTLLYIFLHICSLDNLHAYIQLCIVSVEAALLRALESGKVAGAALDVYTSEPPKAELMPLLSHPNVVCTPHLGASTDEAQVNVSRDIAVQMCDVFDQRDYVGIVNVSYMAAATQPPMKPFMQLALIMGTLVSQLSSSRIVGVELKTWGGRDVSITSKQARQLLEAKVLKGILKHAGLGLNPDIISAPLMARENGIESIVSEALPENVGSPYWNLVNVTVTREDGSSSSITGSVFGKVPQIVHIDQYDDLFSFRPEGNHILTFRNDDRPGAIAEVLEILGSADINVGNVNVARSKTAAPGQSRALCFMALDDDVPTNAMNALRSLPSLHHVAKIQLR